MGSRIKTQKEQDVGKEVMGGSKGKAPQRRAQPRRPASAEQESGSASADGAPSRDRRLARGKAHKARPAKEPDATEDEGTSGGRRKSTEETRERQGSSQRPRGRRPTESREPGDSRGELREEQRLPKRGRRRRGKERGPSAPGRDADTSGGDGGSSCLDSEHHEALDSSSQGGGASERPTKTEPGDTGSEGALIRSPGATGSSHQDNGGHALGLRSGEGPSGSGPRGAGDDSRTDADSSSGWAGHGRRPRKTPGASSSIPESQETELGGEAVASGSLGSSCANAPRGPLGPLGSKAIADVSDSDVGAQPKAELLGTEPETAEAPRAQRLQVGEAAGKVQVVKSDAGARGGAGAGDPAPLAALLVLRKLRARAPAGASPQPAGGLRVGLKARLQRVAQALGLLRWLRLRVQQHRGDARGESPREHKERGRERALEARGGLRGPPRWRAVRLACRAVLRAPPRAPPGGSPSLPQALKSPSSEGASAIEDAAPDPKFAVVFPRIHSAEKESGGGSSGASTDAPTGEGRVSSPAGAAEYREEQGAREEGVVRSHQPPSFSPSAPDGTPPDENRSEAEPDTLEVESRVHWAQGSTPCADPGVGTGTLLPQLTLETRLQQNSPCRSPREQWEPEDDAEAALERALELSLEMPPFPGAKTRSLPEALEDTEDLARLR